MSAHTHEHRDYGFVIGLLTGTLVGAGLAMFVAPPSASELRRRTTGPAESLGKGISEHDLQSTRAGDSQSTPHSL